MHKKSFAKINYNLKVYEKMPSGYHAMQSYMQKVSFYDDMHFEIKDSPKLVIDVQVEHKPELSGEGNIAYKAAQLYSQKANLSVSISIQIKKNVFMAAGLAGGSSNAATTLMALNEHFQSLDFSELISIAKKLGSDVPFFMYDCDLMYVHGRGVDCKPEQQLEPKPLLLINPLQEVSTAQIYQALNRTETEMQRDEYIAIEDYGDIDLIIKQGNDMQSKAIEQCPKIQDILDVTQALDGCLSTQMSGSGATVWALFDDEVKAQGSYAKLKNLGKCIFTWTGRSSCFKEL